MGMSLQSLRDSLRSSLGVDSTDLDDPSADSLLNRALWEMTEKFPFREKEISTNFTITSALGFKYTLPSVFEALLDVAIQDPTSLVYTPLNRMTKVKYDSVYSTDVNDKLTHTKPTDYVRDNACIIFWPTPDQDYNVKIRFLKTIADLTDAAPDLTLPQSWHEIVLLGATWRGFIQFGDYDRADRAKQHQVSLITSSVPIEAKEEFDTHLGGVEVLGRGGKL
jgi:hypothetical protein